MRRLLIPLLVFLIAAASLWQQQADKALPAPEPAGIPSEAGSRLPAEAPETVEETVDEAVEETVELIRQGGPFPYRQDGKEFRNREGLLPNRERGYYREYTVSTPGSPDRGARRIVTGGSPPSVWYYTADHYRSFSPIDPAGDASR